MRSVLCLPVIGRNPIEIIENDLASCSEVDANARSMYLADKDADGVLRLKSIDERLPFLRGYFACYHDRLFAKCLRETPCGMRETREENDFLTLINSPLHVLDCVRHLSNGKSTAST